MSTKNKHPWSKTRYPRILKVKGRWKRRLGPWLFIIFLSGLLCACFVTYIRRRSYNSYSNQERQNKNTSRRINSTWIIVDDWNDDVTWLKHGRGDVHVVVLGKEGSVRCSDAADCSGISRFIRHPDTGLSVLLPESKIELSDFILKLPPSTRSKMGCVLFAISQGAEWVYIGERSVIDMERLEDLKTVERKTGMVYSMPGYYHPVHHHYKHHNKLVRNNDDNNNDDDDVDGDHSNDDNDDGDIDANLPEIKSGRYDIEIVTGRGVYVFHPPCISKKYCLQSIPPIYLAPGSWTSLPVSSMSILAHRRSFWFLIAAILGHNGNDNRHEEEESSVLIGLILQRLMWETNQMLAFLPPSSKGLQFINSGSDRRSTHSGCQNNQDSDCREINTKSTKILDKDGIQNNYKIVKNCHRRYREPEIINNQIFKRRQRGLIKIISKMCSSKNVSFYTCTQKFISTSINIFTNSQDGFKKSLNFFSKWLQILVSLGYKFPPRLPLKELMKLRKTVHKIPMWFAPSPCKPRQRFKGIGNNEFTREENGTAAGGWLNLVDENLCKSSGSFQDGFDKNFVPQRFKFWDILLIIVFNYPYLASHVPLLLAMYGRHIRHILFCGEHFSSFAKFYKMDAGIGVSFVEINHYEGTWGYSCMSAAIKMNYDVTGYLQMSDDVLLNVWNLEGVPRDRCWFQSRVRVADTRLTRVPDIATTNRWYPWIFSVGQIAAKNSLTMIKRLERYGKFKPVIRPFLDRLANTSQCHTCLLYEASDIFYVPKHLLKGWAMFADIFQTNSVHLEIAIPSAIFGLSPEADVFRLRGNYIWGDDRADFRKYYSPNDHFQHAFKLSRLAVPEDARFFCQSYLSWLERDLIQGGIAGIKEDDDGTVEQGNKDRLGD